VAAHLLDPAGIFHREGETLIRQERDIRDDADYNAILVAVAAGATDWAEIANQSHVDSKSLSNYLTRLQHLGRIHQELPFGEKGKRGIYRLADNMLKAWYRYVFRHRSALEMASSHRRVAGAGRAGSSGLPGSICAGRRCPTAPRPLCWTLWSSDDLRHGALVEPPAGRGDRPGGRASRRVQPVRRGEMGVRSVRRSVGSTIPRTHGRIHSIRRVDFPQ